MYYQFLSIPITGRLTIFSRSMSSYLLLLLVVAGNTGFSSNPGSCKFPCGICSKPVKLNQAGIECEECLLWFHTKCIHQTIQSYEVFQNNSELTWICSSRLFPIFFKYALYISLNNYSILEHSADSGDAALFKPLMTSSPEKRNATSDKRESGTDNSTTISFLCANVNSIRGKTLELQSHLEIHAPEIVALQDTKIDPTIMDSELFPPELGYSVFKKDRCTGGGGVLLAIKSSLNPSTCNNIDTDNFESVWATVRMRGKWHYFL